MKNNHARWVSKNREFLGSVIDVRSNNEVNTQLRFVENAIDKDIEYFKIKNRSQENDYN